MTPRRSIVITGGLAAALAACGPGSKDVAAPAPSTAEVGQADHAPADDEAVPAPVAADEPPVTYQTDGGRVVPSRPIAFEPGTATLTRSSEPVIAVVRDYLVDKPHVTLLRVEAHMSAAGDAGQRLSEQRALAVARALVALGVDCQRLLPIGFGASKPVSVTAADNERIELVNAELRGKAIGGMPVDGGGRLAGDPCR